MAHACDIVAWIRDGAVYCPDCKPDKNSGPHAEEPSPVFESDELSDATCDSCGCYYDGSEWVSHEEATGESYRWSTCVHCGTQHGWNMMHSEYKDARKLALQGKLVCHNCMKTEVHF